MKEKVVKKIKIADLVSNVLFETKQLKIIIKRGLADRQKILRYHKYIYTYDFLDFHIHV